MSPYNSGCAQCRIFGAAPLHPSPFTFSPTKHPLKHSQLCVNQQLMAYNPRMYWLQHFSQLLLWEDLGDGHGAVFMLFWGTPGPISISSFVLRITTYNRFQEHILASFPANSLSCDLSSEVHSPKSIFRCSIDSWFSRTKQPPCGWYSTAYGTRRAPAVVTDAVIQCEFAGGPCSTQG
jgi:hypothetical protein